ncbi:MAG: hypothetical protein COA52_16245 [Hyphomicrobiales bacterium]|nr:alpha/beta fold hydrolase [Hyphomicrobiales bacterium]PCJ85392.1 MAG: hypothetical protein COA52_16245 [Hyphomicrobiales bacterium]
MTTINPKTAFVLVHGSWHGAWCWGHVEHYLNLAGHLTVAIDLPGHGLSARIPKSFNKRPLDAKTFETEQSAFAAIEIEEYTAAVIGGADRARAMGADNIVAVGHSMGGVPLSFAAAHAPEKFDALVYLAALATLPGKPSKYYLDKADQSSKEQLTPFVIGEPDDIGAIRIDTRSTDADYAAAGKSALAADVDPVIWDTVLHLLTPDAPEKMHRQYPEFKQGFGALKRTYIRCLHDLAILPSTGEAIVADMNALWPDNPTKLVDMDCAHEPMFAKPEELARMLVASLS